MPTVTLNYVGSIPPLINISPAQVFPCGDGSYTVNPIRAGSLATFKLFASGVFPFGTQGGEPAPWWICRGVWNDPPSGVRMPSCLQHITRTKSSYAYPPQYQGAAAQSVGAFSSGMLVLFNNNFNQTIPNNPNPAKFTSTEFAPAVMQTPPFIMTAPPAGTPPYVFVQAFSVVGFMGWKDHSNIYVAVDSELAWENGTDFGAETFSGGVYLYNIPSGEYSGPYASGTYPNPNITTGPIVNGVLYVSSWQVDMAGNLYYTDTSGNNQVIVGQTYNDGVAALQLMAGGFASYPNGWRHILMPGGAWPNLDSSPDQSDNAHTTPFFQTGPKGDYSTVVIGSNAVQAPYALIGGVPTQIQIARYQRAGVNNANPPGYVGLLYWNKKPVYVLSDGGNWDLYVPVNLHYAVAFNGMRNFTRPISPTQGEIK